MRTADYLGLLFRSRLVMFAPKEEMCRCDNQIVTQFLEGRAQGPIAMDEMADAEEIDAVPAG